MKPGPPIATSRWRWIASRTITSGGPRVGVRPPPRTWEAPERADARHRRRSRAVPLVDFQGRAGPAAPILDRHGDASRVGASDHHDRGRIGDVHEKPIRGRIEDRPARPAGDGDRRPERCAIGVDGRERGLSHNGEDPARRACRRGAAVCSSRSPDLTGASGQSLATVSSRPAKPTAEGRPCQPRGRPSHACEQEVSRGRQDAEEAAETQEAEATEEDRRVEDPSTITSWA